MARYGSSKSFALITGATDGIGLAYAKELAKDGFNLIIVGRNPQKLEQRRKEILEINPKNEIRTIVQDFNIPFSERTYNSFIQGIKDQEISILVNNVGLMHVYEYHKYPVEKLMEILNVNVEATTFVTRLIVPSMLKRSKRCGVITVSSGLGDISIPYGAVYSATKAFETYFTNALALEYKNSNIDFLNVHTGEVTTLANPNANSRHISPQEAARSHLRCLGKDTNTTGHVKHLIGSIMIQLPFFNRLIGKGLKAVIQSDKKNE